MTVNRLPSNNDLPFNGTELAIRLDGKLISIPKEQEANAFCYCDHFCEFVEKALVFDGSDPYKDDQSSVLIDLPSVNNTALFFLITPDGERVAITDNTLGIFYDKGDLTGHPSKTGALINWFEVSQIYQFGRFSIEVDIDIFGSSQTKKSHKYEVLPFSDEIADETIKIETYHSNCIENGIDYTGLNWYRSIRLPGFFGQNVYQKTIEDYISEKRSVLDNQERVWNEYSLFLDMIPQSIRDQLNRDAFLASKKYITDYNIFNPFTNGGVDAIEKISYRKKDVVRFEETNQEFVEGSPYGAFEYKCEDRDRGIISRHV